MIRPRPRGSQRDDDGRVVERDPEARADRAASDVAGGGGDHVRRAQLEALGAVRLGEPEAGYDVVQLAGEAVTRSAQHVGGDTVERVGQVGGERRSARCARC